MNYFTKKRFSGGLVLLLLIINIAAIATMAYHIVSEKSEISSGQISPGAGKIILDKLDLNEQQLEQFHSLNREYRIQSNLLLDAMTKKRSEMLSELSMQEPDTLILNTLAAEIGKFHTELKLLTIQNFLALKAICNAEQQVKLSELYSDLMQCEGHFQGFGKQYRYRHGQEVGRRWRNNP